MPSAAPQWPSALTLAHTYEHAPVALGWCVLKGWDTVDWHRRVGYALARCALMLVAAGSVAGWWYLRNTQLYGDALGLAVFQAEFTTQAFEPAKIDAWLSALTLLHESFWARFGWMNVPAPGWTIAPRSASLPSSFATELHPAS